MNLAKGRFRKKGSFMNYGIRVRENRGRPKSPKRRSSSCMSKTQVHKFRVVRVRRIDSHDESEKVNPQCIAEEEALASGRRAAAR